MLRKAILLWMSGLVVGLYATLVLSYLWNWFVVPIFHVSEISFWMMYGLTMLIRVFWEDDEVWHEHRHGILALMLNVCIPDEKRAALTEELTEHDKSLWTKSGFQIMGRVIGITITLLTGFLVHLWTSTY